MPYIFDWLEDHPYVCIAVTASFVILLWVALAEGILSTWRQL